jgi:hypothetical protein
MEEPVYDLFLEIKEQEYIEKYKNKEGFCSNCEKWNKDIDPNAINSCCEFCGENRVFGIEQSIIFNVISINIE